MPKTRIKICGITRPDDAALAAELGADAIGLNFVGGPREITVIRAFQILQDLPPITSVGLADRYGPEPDSSDPLTHHRSLPLKVLQLYHYKYSDPYFKSQWDRFDYWIVRHVGSREDLRELAGEWALRPGPSTQGCIVCTPIEPAALLLDTASIDKLGGTGQPFNWHWIAEARAAGELANLPPLILAGGLTPDNVANAIRIAQPYAVDVSSGVEVPGKPGIKDPAKLLDFIQAAQSA